MKVTVENKKGLNKDLKVFVDKKTIETYMNEKYEEVKKQVSLKGFRPGKAPKEILKRQFGKSIYGEVLDKVLKETSAKAIQENKIKPAGQPGDTAPISSTYRQSSRSPGLRACPHSARAPEQPAGEPQHSTIR